MRLHGIPFYSISHQPFFTPLDSQRNLSVPIPHTIQLPVQFGGAKINVVSFNMENFDARDPEVRMQARADVILQSKADVIALQEVDSKIGLQNFNQKYLSGEYPNIFFVNCERSWKQSLAIMSRNNIALEETKIHPGIVRNFAEVTVNINGFKFVLFNAHFKAKKMFRPEKETLPIRLAEARRLSDIIQRKMRVNPYIMVVGDLNTFHTEFGRPVLDALSNTQDSNPNNRLVEIIEDGRDFPMTNKHIKDKIDYCFVSPKLATLMNIPQSCVLGDFNAWPNNTASDHLAIRGVIDVCDVEEAPTSISA